MVEGDHVRLAASTGTALVAPFGDGRGHVSDWLRDLREPLVMTPESPGVDKAEFAALDARKVLALPFVAQGELFGVAVLDEPGREADFDDERIGVGQAVAGFAALMINNASLYERRSQLAAELAERSSTLEALLRLGYELRATLDLDQVLAARRRDGARVARLPAGGPVPLRRDGRDLHRRACRWAARPSSPATT